MTSRAIVDTDPAQAGLNTAFQQSNNQGRQVVLDAPGVRPRTKRISVRLHITSTAERFRGLTNRWTHGKRPIPNESLQYYELNALVRKSTQIPVTTSVPNTAAFSRYSSLSRVSKISTPTVD